jgi:hypothetical protein
LIRAIQFNILPAYEMTKLSILSVALGLSAAVPAIYGLVKPSEFAASLRKFPRSVPIGIGLVLIATAWFLYNLSQESIADFAAYKGVLYALFAGVGIGTCIFVQDLIAVRGLAVVLLLLGKLMVDTGRPFLDESRWVLLIQTLAYVLVFAGMWFTISPWRLRDLLEWGISSEARLKKVCALKVGLGVLLVILAIAAF